MPKPLIFTILAVLLLAALYWAMPTSSPPVAQSLAPTSITNQTATPSPLFPSTNPDDAKEITFKNSLAFKDKMLSIDEGPFQSIPCAKSQADYQVFGFLPLFGDKAELTCLDDYLGGISIVYMDSAGARTEGLATVDGDAGDMWEGRTWILRDPETKTYKIRTVGLSSSVNIDDDKLTSCTVTDTTLTWDKRTKEFKRHKSSEPFDLKLFTPPIHVHPGCLAADGQWQGLRK